MRKNKVTYYPVMSDEAARRYEWLKTKAVSAAEMTSSEEAELNSLGRIKVMSIRHEKIMATYTKGS